MGFPESCYQVRFREFLSVLARDLQFYKDFL